MKMQDIKQKVRRIPLEMLMLQVKRKPKNNRDKPSTQAVQTQGLRTAHIRRRHQTQRATLHRTRSRVRTNETKYAEQTLPTLRQRQSYNGLCILRHSFQHQKDVL